MTGQFEQELNAFLLHSLAYGANGTKICRETISSFLYHLPDYKEKLKGYRAEDNSALTAKIDKLLANNCALLKKIQQAAKLTGTYPGQ